MAGELGEVATVDEASAAEEHEASGLRGRRLWVRPAWTYDG
jgi:hypothetical protein